jgi:hypothetical protein
MCGGGCGCVAALATGSYWILASYAWVVATRTISQKVQMGRYTICAVHMHNAQCTMHLY